MQSMENDLITEAQAPSAPDTGAEGTWLDDLPAVNADSREVENAADEAVNEVSPPEDEAASDLTDVPPHDDVMTKPPARPMLRIGPLRLRSSWAACGISLVAHAVLAGGALWAMVHWHRFTPPVIQFAWGDGASELGQVDRTGQPDVSAGAVGTGLPGPRFSNEASSGVAARLASLAKTPPEAAFPAPKAPPIAPHMSDAAPPPMVPAPNLLHTNLKRSPAPPVALASFSKLPLEPAKVAPISAPPPAVEDSSKKSSASAGAAPASASSALPGGSGGSAPAGEGTAALAGGGGGAGTGFGRAGGGASTGVDGNAATGRFGIPSGIRDHLPHPEYPSLSRRYGEEGTVVLQVELYDNGRVGAIDVLSDAGYPRLARAAVESLRKWRFPPARLDDRPVRCVFPLSFKFRLQ